MRASLLLCCLALASCNAQTHPTHAPTLGMANPASVYCEKIGGTVQIRNEKGGQVGYCHLPDGTVKEEWALFRSAHPSPH
ncbi:DUF333 domain-containing protein [Neokomagataea tanensis]|uniref:DUF333 domain-containing protein n=1 Tax=Neokomagataea tanensis TaxID=661191 RepID=A0A4Y6V8J1_9PROT|nr:MULTISPECIES: DUF333 domain-containing protein [Neokomagataea]QDH24797.1 DUF333 domain-containing protein [Neokomagataea tanensis]